MDRTLFTPSMIETFRVCKRAYQIAYAQSNLAVDLAAESKKASVVSKRFLLKALAEINRGRITNVSQVQKFLGQHWPADKIQSDVCVKAFLFVYKTLIHYVNHRYQPTGAAVVGANLKVRARIPHKKVYLEDTFDLILYHPSEKHLELVDFHLHPLKAFDQAWPSASMLVKQFLAERLSSRWPFKKLSLTFAKLSPQGLVPTTLFLEEGLFKAHWASLVTTIEEMQEQECKPYNVPAQCYCRRCVLLASGHKGQMVNEAQIISRSA